MATVKGRLAAADILGTATLTDVYTVPVNKEADVNIYVTNRSDVDTLLQVAFIKGDVAANVSTEDYLTFDLPTSSLASNLAPLSYTGFIMAAGDTIAVSSSASAVTVQVNGIEGDA